MYRFCDFLRYFCALWRSSIIDRFRLRNDLPILVSHFYLLLDERKGRESARRVQKIKSKLLYFIALKYQICNGPPLFFSEEQFFSNFFMNVIYPFKTLLLTPLE